METTVIGLVENIIILKNNKRHSIKARIDSGAIKSSIDQALAKELKLGPTLRRILIKSAHGSKRRQVIALDIELKEKKIYKTEFTLADRSHMTYQALIGQNVLKKGFIIDPRK